MKKGAVNKNIKRDVDPNQFWDIIGELGDGAFGKVYKAQHKENGTFAALKQVEIKTEEDLEDFSVEIDILTACRHKNVVDLYEAFYHNGILSMFIEYCGAGAVDSIMVDLEKPLNEDQIRYICREMCEGLDFIHKHRVIHRDLKAGNVLLTMDGSVKLADFGVSALNAKTIQRRDSFIGTPYWMAPEVILCETVKDTPYSYKADIWSLGITLIEFAQIEPPNHEMHPMRVLIKIQKADPPHLDDVRKWSKTFQDFLRLCLTKDPEKRPTVEELLQHPFLENVNRKSVLMLISESKAEVVETVEDLTVEEDIKQIKRQLSDESNTDLDKISVNSDISSNREKTPEKVENEKNETEEHRMSVIPERPKTPEQELDKAPKQSPKRNQAPKPPQVVTEEKQSPRAESESPREGSVSSRSEGEASLGTEESVKERTPSPDKDKTPSPRSTPEKDKSQTSIRVSPVPMEPLPDLSEKELSEDSFKESPREVQIDITPIASELVEDLIDEVMKSSNKEPSVPAVVLDTMQSIFEEEEERPLVKEDHVVREDDEKEKEKLDNANAELEKLPRQSSVSEIISNFEAKDKEDTERKSVSPKTSPRRSMSPGELERNRINSSEDRSLSEDSAIEEKDEGTEKTGDTVTVNTVSGKTDDVVTVTNKREMEIQAVKVRIDDDEIVTSNIDDVITINGQPVPAASTVVINGHVTRIQNTPQREVDKQRSLDRETENIGSPENEVVSNKDKSKSPVANKKKDKGYIQQTDLDTFETKITNDVEPSEVSNLDDDSSDQKSDTGSINTVDSLDKEERNNITVANKDRKLKGRSESKSQYRTMTKTRTYMQDGVVVTSTTQKVVLAGEEHKVREDHFHRKQDLRELKVLQKNENKQYQDLIYKAQVAREIQDRKFETDMQSLVKNYDQDMETLTKQQKQQVEKAEGSQTVDLKNAAKKIKLEQEREHKSFKEKQKQDMKLLKQELDMMAKNSKKEEIRKRKEQKEIQLTEEERQFMENQQERMDKHMKQLTETHRQKIAMLESQFLQQKQQLLRAREAATWELEKQQLHEKHQLAKSQLKDMFFLKRHQMLTRHQKEVEQMKRSNTTKEEEMQRRHVLEKKRLPKILKQEAKTRSMMFKQSLRLSIVGSQDDERAKLKQFEENERKRMKSEQTRQENKHKKQWDELLFRNESSLRELEQLQAEKRKMLMEIETQKIKELDEQYSNELREWKAMLVPRKQRLEEDFAKQREEQEKFYGAVVMTGESTYVPRSAPSSTRHKPDDSLKSRHSTVI